MFLEMDIRSIGSQVHLSYVGSRILGSLWGGVLVQEDEKI